MVDCVAVCTLTDIFFPTFVAVRPCPALHTFLVSSLVAHIMAEVVIAWTAYFIAFGAIVVFITAHTDGVANTSNQSFIFHHLFLLSRVNHSSVDAAHYQ